MLLGIVMVVWGKSKKTYNAEVIHTSVGVHSSPTPQLDATTDDDTLVFEMVAPASQTRTMDLLSQSQPMLHKWQETY